MVFQPFPPAAAAAANANALAGWMANANHSSPVQPAVIAASASSLPVPQNQGKINVYTVVAMLAIRYIMVVQIIMFKGGILFSFYMFLQIIEFSATYI